MVADDGGPPSSEPDSGLVCTHDEYAACSASESCPTDVPACVVMLRGSWPPQEVYDSGVFLVIDAGMACCVPPFEACDRCSSCCSGGCTNGTCEPLLPGMGCFSDEGCGPGLSCGRPLFSYGFHLGCCIDLGHPCTDAGSPFGPLGDAPDCCSGHCGANGTCACVPAGSGCTPLTYDGGCCSGECGAGGRCR